MLEDLENVNWGQLRHAYGAATDVPDLLRALASPDKENRSQALHALYGNIWHQGTVYEATAFAVPFLIELLRAPSVQGKEEILGLLQAISRGNSYLDVHQHMEMFRQERQTPAFQEQRSTEISWVRKAQAAVSDGVPVYRALLACPSVELRVGSAYVLANCTDRVREAGAPLRGRLRRERHSLVRAALVWAWLSTCRIAHRQGLAGTPSKAGVKRMLGRLVRSRKERAVVRLLAGLGLMLFLPEKDYPGFARFFAAALAHCPRGLARLPWMEGEPMRFVYCVLAHQRALVLSLFSLIVENPAHPHREQTTYQLEEIIHAQPRARPAVALLLGKLLDSANGKARRSAARLLGQMGSSRQLARDELAKALGDAEADVARHAAVALSKIGDVRAVAYLKERLAQGDAHPLVLQAIKRFGKDASDCIPPLRELVRSAVGNSRVLAVHALALMGEESTDAVPEVAELLWEPSAAGAGWALMQWGPLAREAVPQIVQFLQDEGAKSSGRVNAVKALGRMGLHARPALGVLRRLLHDPVPEVRAAAAGALWKVAPREEEAVPVIVEALGGLKEKPRQNNACASALEALEDIGPAARSSAALVRELLDNTYQWTRVRAARVLWRMGEPLETFLPTLIEELRCRPVGLLAAECLAEIGPSAAAAVPRLREILASEWGVSEGGIADEMMDREEEFLQAVSLALKAIQGGE